MAFFEWAVLWLLCAITVGVYRNDEDAFTHSLLRPVIWLGIVSLLMTVWTAGNHLYEFLP